MTSRTGKGFALVEVLMSVAILSVGAVFILQALANVSYAVTVAERQAQCHLFILSKAAELELAFREGRSLEERTQGTFRIQNQRFDWELHISPVDGPLQVQSMLFSIRWSDAGHTFERELQTLLRSYEASS